MTENDKCQICGTSKSKYSCPRCQIPYCSVGCYQSENHLQCSENFYEQCVQEELRNCESDPEAQRKMLEIIRRNQADNSEESLDSDDDEAVADLETRIKNVDLDDEEAVWETLTPEEKQEFKKLVASGNIFKILPEWEPWWKTKKRKSLIQDCSEPFDCRSVCPSIPSEIPMLVELTKAKPSPNVAYMLLNVLLSYVFTMRLFKGAHKDMPVEVVSTFTALSATLRNNDVFTSSFEAFAAFENDYSKCKWVKDSEFNKIIIQQDLNDIIKGSEGGDSFFCVKAAISDLNSLCTQAISILKQNNTNHIKRFSGPPPSVKLLQQISKKMIYYLSWTVEYGNLLTEIL